MGKISISGSGDKAPETKEDVAQDLTTEDIVEDVTNSAEHKDPESLRPAPAATSDIDNEGHPAQVVNMQHSDIQSRLRQAAPRDLNIPVLGQYEAVIKADPLNLVAPSGKAIRFEHGRFEATTTEEVEYLQEFIDRGLVRKLEEL